MIDISKYPYFAYREILESLLLPITEQADIQLLSFHRRYTNRRRFLIAHHTINCMEYFLLGFYKYGLFEKDPQDYVSGFHMWDHLPCDPNGIYEYARSNHGLAHGLTILHQYGAHLDAFVFATKPGNMQINNFFLNQKEIFNNFMTTFYNELHNTLDELSQHTFFCPGNSGTTTSTLINFSPRQQDCAALLMDGLTAKEIAKILHISNRTVEYHIDILRTKFKAKNRLQLLNELRKHIRKV